MVFRIVMTPYHVINRAAVAGYITIHSIGFPGDRINKVFACRNGHAVYSAVSCHDCRKLIVPDKGPVWKKVKFAHIAVVHVRAARVAVKLRIVGEIMLSAGNGFQVGGIVAH